MASIYAKLCELVESGKYYEYWNGHVANMECFYHLQEILDRLDKRQEYNRLYVDYFRIEITDVLNMKNGKLHLDLSDYANNYLTLNKTSFEKGCNSLSEESKRKILNGMDEHKLSCSNEIPALDVLKALESLSNDDQCAFLTGIVAYEVSTEKFLASIFGMMMIHSNNMAYAEIVLMAQAALQLYDEQSLEACRKFFRKIDVETQSGFKMNL